MNIRRLTWLNYVEIIFGGIIPTVYLGPPVFLGLIFLVGGVVKSVFTLSIDFFLNLSSLKITLTSVVGSAALFALWTVILYGTSAVRARPRLHAFIIVALLAGLATEAYYYLDYFLYTSEKMHSTWLPFFGPAVLIPLIGPAIIAMRYLPSLLKRETVS